MAFLMEAPAPPIPQQTPPAQPMRAAPMQTEMHDGTITAPRKIPRTILQLRDPEPALPGNVAGMDPNWTGSGNPNDVFRGQTGSPIVRPEIKGPVHLPSSTVTALLVDKVLPVYPRVGIAMHLEGTVVLAAIISKAGTIENLHVVSGSPILQQAALDAVKSWRYRPYLLDGQPVEVETTVNVIFTLGR
jgi:protein TonB